MRLKKVVVEGAKKAFGIRMARAGFGCVPDIRGLFLLDENMEWRATSIQVDIGVNIPSYLPVRLVGNICDEEVTWETEWQPTGPGTLFPIFSGIGPVGIVGYQLYYEYFIYYSTLLSVGVLRISATCAGRKYGPVNITFLGGAPPER